MTALRLPRGAPSMAQALDTLAAAGLKYRAVVDDPSAWEAQCPGCGKWTLKLSVVGWEEGYDTHDLITAGAVAVGCTSQCHPPTWIRAWLCRDLRLVQKVRVAGEIGEWRAWELVRALRRRDEEILRLKRESESLRHRLVWWTRRALGVSEKI